MPTAAALTLAQLLLRAPCEAEQTDGQSDFIVVHVQIALPDSQAQHDQLEALQQIPARLKEVHASLQREWWEKYAVSFGMLATLFAVGVAHWLSERSRQRAADATLDTLLSEAIEDLRRLCYITELHSIGSRSKASIPRAARQHLMSQVASLTKNRSALTALTRAYSDFDRVTAYQDRAVKSDADGEEKAASYAQGVAVAFILSSISGVLANLDETSKALRNRIRVPDDVRQRAILITQFRDDFPALCAIGTVCVKTREGNGSAREIVKHLHWMEQTGPFLKPDTAISLLPRLRGKYLTFNEEDEDIQLVPSVKSATESSWRS